VNCPSGVVGKVDPLVGYDIPARHVLLNDLGHPREIVVGVVVLEISRVADFTRKRRAHGIGIPGVRELSIGRQTGDVLHFRGQSAELELQQNSDPPVSVFPPRTTLRIRTDLFALGRFP
jgi:hypothetical protein